MRANGYRARYKRLAWAIVAALLPAGGCSTTDQPPEGVGWRFEEGRAEEGRFVRTVGGSVWSSIGVLEPVARIGEIEGDETRILGDAVSVALWDDRIYVLDVASSRVRVYDFSGAFLFDLGGAGPGPGEFEGPYLVAVDGTGSVHVRDLVGLESFGPEGEQLASRTVPGGGIVLPMVATDTSTVWVPGRAAGEGGQVDAGWFLVSQEDHLGPFIQEPISDAWRPWFLEAHGNGSSLGAFVPFAPREEWTVGAWGSLIRLEGDRYRITLANGDPAVIERAVPPVEIPRPVRDFSEASVAERMRRIDPGWRWNGSPIPEHLPLASSVTSDARGRIWVTRAVAVELLQDCGSDEGEECLVERYVIDLFRRTGEFLGTLDPGVAWEVGVPIAVWESHFALVLRGPFDIPIIHLFQVPTG